MKLKFYREKLNLSQSEIANKLGIKQTTYSSYETGRNEPDIAMLINLANFFHISIDELVEREYDGINFSKLNDYHYSLISKISKSNEKECIKISSYIDGIQSK